MAHPRASNPMPRPTTHAHLPASLAPRPGITHVVFDFDGTLSWIRHGWPALMHAVFARHWPASDQATSAQRAALFDSIVFGLNGRPTLVQMQHYAQLLAERQVQRDPEALCAEYQDELDCRISERLAKIRSRQVPQDAFVIHGARPLLEWLSKTGMELIILSGTVEHRVREEADALGLKGFFKDRIHGSGTVPAGFSKLDVLQRILEQDGISGEHLLSFGDGPAEIASTKKLGGFAIAICSDETHNGSGEMDPVKCRQLLDAGADAAFPDFRDLPTFLEYLLQK
jgi:phosphoglycolate phosphatase-like HAD superfamily hydrolase